MRVLLIILVSSIIMVGGCSQDADPETFSYKVNRDQILCNGVEFEIRGVVYVPGYPGYLPWEIESSQDLPSQLKESIQQDIKNIKDMNANTIRLWGAPEVVYDAVRETGGLHILQTLWIDSEFSDLLDTEFFNSTTTYFSSVVDRIYRAYGNTSPPVVAYIVGNEISESSIRSTIDKNPGLYSYEGFYLSADSLSAPEYFLIQLGDWLKQYVHDNYGDIPLVTYANDIRTDTLIDTPFLDFRSHNAYSYAISYYLSSLPVGSVSNTHFQGWIEYLKNKHPDIPLLITETGLSVSPNASNTGSPDYGYGGNTEEDQEDGLLQNLNDINTASFPCAGVVIHEYLDSWWKFGYDDSFSQDPDDIEEWFGLYRLERINTWYKVSPRPVVSAISNIWSNSSQ